ncbi:MAG: hypothetical protein GEU82_08925 [Luteitalea sp.]|nr:hypothetical protein [Luteitalea sp.]
MSALFLRTLSQGLQAFVPIAVALTWFRRTDAAVAAALWHGALLSVPATVAATWAFKRSTSQARDEAVFATLAFVIAVGFARMVWRRRLPRLWLATAAAVLILVRQTMEIGSVFTAAAFDMRSFDATAAILAASILALSVAWLWSELGRRLPEAEIGRATRICAVVFLVQVLVYAFHEASEARLLPFSEALHTATEPYGPDGIYGMHLSELLVALPVVAVIAMRARRSKPLAVIGFASLLAIGHVAGPGGLAASAKDLAPAADRPHVLFRETGKGPDFGMLSLVPVDSPEGERVSTGLSCERVSFGGSNGLCLRAERGLFGLFITYTALPLDAALKPRGTPTTLQGRPSRTRVSPDGRFGATTVFTLGDDYASSGFSTRTTLVDLTNGADLGDLEQFATWRNGERFSSRDFNFWGVTFGRDSNIFYASLRTAGSTYLVRGELASRKLTVLRENVECPSLSPDNRLIAFKKHVGPGPGGWRLAVLDVATMKEHLLPGETRSIDDQVEWLDDTHVLYSIPRRTTSIADVWIVSVDGDSPARVFLSQAESPIVVR